MDILKTNNLTKTYKGIPACDHINITIHKGDIYGFIGENGSGKTTLIRMITGLINPTSGDYELFGKGKSSEIRAMQNKVSAVVETPSLHLNLSGIDNLKMQQLITGKRDDKQIAEILDLVGLSTKGIYGKQVKDYSLGMRQRLSIGIALISNPEFLILDEPMNGLDPEGIVSMRNLILKLNEELGITFLISSHILDELAKVATRYGFIHRGSIIEEISKEEMLLKTRSFVDLVVDNKDKAITILESLNLKDVETFNNTVRIYGTFEISKVLLKLSSENINVINMKQTDGSVESYYLRLMEERHAKFN